MLLLCLYPLWFLSWRKTVVSLPHHLLVQGFLFWHCDPFQQKNCSIINIMFSWTMTCANPAPNFVSGPRGLMWINYSFPLYLNPGLNGPRSFFSVGYLNLKSQLKRCRKTKHLLFRQHWTYIHRCLDLVRSNRRYGTAHNPVVIQLRTSRAQNPDWRNERHLTQKCLRNSFPKPAASNLDYHLQAFYVSKWKRK